MALDRRYGPGGRGEIRNYQSSHKIQRYTRKEADEYHRGAAIVKIKGGRELLLAKSKESGKKGEYDYSRNEREHIRIVEIHFFARFKVAAAG